MLTDQMTVARNLADPSPMLARLETALAQARTRGDVAWATAEAAGIGLGLFDCVVYLSTGRPAELAQIAAWGHKQVAPRIFENPIRLNFDQGIVGACAASKAPLLIADTRLDHRYVVDVSPQLSELAVPITLGSRLLGVIDAEHPDADYFRSQHVRALIRIAEAAAERLATI